MSRPAPSGPTEAKPVAGGPSSDSLGQRVRSLRLPQQDSTARRSKLLRSSLLPGVLAVAVGVLGYLYFDLRLSQPATAPAARSESDREPSAANAPIALTAAGEGTVGGNPVALESKGYIIPTQRILVSPEVSGRILKLSIEEGMRVEKGDVLAEVDRTEYQADFDRALAFQDAAQQLLLELERGSRAEEIAQATAELAEARVQLPQLEAEWKRNEQLRKTNVVSELEFERAESAYRAMLHRLERLESALQLMQIGPRPERIAAARAALRQAEADVVKARRRLEHCTIVAPVTGTILVKKAEEGNFVNPISFNGSFSVCEMADLSNLEVELNIQERDVSRVFCGQKCAIRTEAYPDRVYDGFVSRLMPIADRAKGALPVRIKILVPDEEEGMYLRPEMGAIVTFSKQAASR